MRTLHTQNILPVQGESVTRDETGSRDQHKTHIRKDSGQDNERNFDVLGLIQPHLLEGSPGCMLFGWRQRSNKWRTSCFPHYHGVCLHNINWRRAQSFHCHYQAGDQVYRMAMIIGHIETFDEERKQWSMYVEWFEIFVEVNGISDEKSVSVFLSVMGVSTYKLLCSLITPVQPEAMDYDEIVSTLQAHFTPKPIEILISQTKSRSGWN